MESREAPRKIYNHLPHLTASLEKEEGKGTAAMPPMSATNWVSVILLVCSFRTTCSSRFLLQLRLRRGRGRGSRTRNSPK